MTILSINSTNGWHYKYMKDKIQEDISDKNIEPEKLFIAGILNSK